jgi:CheY-like chemotaxis protein
LRRVAMTGEPASTRMVASLPARSRPSSVSSRIKDPKTQPALPSTIKDAMADFERPPRVLVVEDDEAIAQVLQRSLRMEGYDVKIADDGVAALDVAHAFLPDLVILDLGLPKMDGIEVAKTMRETDDVPILVLTARDAVESRVEGLDAGADDYLVKPFERQELLARLRALLRRRPPRGHCRR